MYHTLSKDGDIMEWAFFGKLRWKEIVIRLYGPDLEEVPRRTARCPGRPPDRRRHAEHRSLRHYSKSDASNSSSQLWVFRLAPGYKHFVLYIQKVRLHTGPYDSKLSYTVYVLEYISEVLVTFIAEGAVLAQSI
jgi:hypothetical protein